ncbi:Uncharacterised protein [Weissella viridescens]|uniref:Uncharacterized protein n=1 Tax=Weissella viridescens TaxID=1629 RepID=A0A380P1J8_WEIVI|nr:Uncharacterised protein [Weissella viridescens]
MSEAGYINNVAERVTINHQSKPWFYTSTNYILLSGVARQLSGKSLMTLFKQEFQDKYHFLNVQEYKKVTIAQPVIMIKDTRLLFRNSALREK